MRCDCRPCNNDAIVKVHYTSDKLNQQYVLCQKHLDDFWKVNNPLCQANLAQVIFDVVDKD